MCEREGEQHRAHIHCTNWGGLVIQAPVNWREGQDNRMSFGRVISGCIILASVNLCLSKPLGLAICSQFEVSHP